MTCRIVLYVEEGVAESLGAQAAAESRSVSQMGALLLERALDGGVSGGLPGAADVEPGSASSPPSSAGEVEA